MNTNGPLVLGTKHFKYFFFFQPVPLIHPQLFYFCSAGIATLIKYFHSSEKFSSEQPDWRLSSIGILQCIFSSVISQCPDCYDVYYHLK